MRYIQRVALVAGCTVFLLAPGCGTLQSATSLASSVVNATANTAVKALSPSTYTGGSKETYNSREPLEKRRNTMSSTSLSQSRSWFKSGSSKSDNPPVGMPYKSRSFDERSKR